jgi:hypothetical protein
MLTAEEAHKIACEAADNARSLEFVEMIVEEKIKAAAEMGKFETIVPPNFIAAAADFHLLYIVEYLVKKLGYKVSVDVLSTSAALTINW